MTETIELRAAQVAEVNFPQRRIELIVMPYEQPARVAYRGKMITEVCSRGAYDGVEQRTRKVLVNFDHEHQRATQLVGKAVALHPSRSEGLVAEVKVFGSAPFGDMALELADEGVLDASAGFTLLADKDGRPVPGAEVWETRDRRRLNHLYLHHIGLTADPAYVGANVLAVRSADDELAEQVATATPNLDQFRQQIRAEELARLYSP